MTTPLKCSQCLAGDFGPCDEADCPFYPTDTGVAGLVKDISEWEKERLRQEHDSMWALAWGLVCFLAALFAVMFWQVGGVIWGSPPPE